MYDARVIADYVIAYYNENNGAVSNYKLQKILYFLQAEFLVQKKKRLFDDEIVAMNFGPVVQNVFHLFKGFAHSSIVRTGATFDKCFKEASFDDSFPMRRFRDTFEKPHLLEEDRIIIDKMLERLREYSESALTEITKNQAPWIRNYSKYETRVVPTDEIYEYFSEDENKSETENKKEETD